MLALLDLRDGETVLRSCFQNRSVAFWEIRRTGIYGLADHRRVVSQVSPALSSLPRSLLGEIPWGFSDSLPLKSLVA